jgi:hypothetical protein
MRICRGHGQGIYSALDLDFFPRGITVEEFPDAYASSTLKDSNGATVPGSNTTTTILTTSHLVYVSNKRLFGAWMAGEVLFPMADVQITRAQGVDASELPAPQTGQTNFRAMSLSNIFLIYSLYITKEITKE